MTKCNTCKASLFFIVRGFYPLFIVDDPDLQALVAVMDPRMKLPCQNTIPQNYLFSLHLTTGWKYLLSQILGATFVALSNDRWFFPAPTFLHDSDVQLYQRALADGIKGAKNRGLPQEQTAQNIASHVVH